MNEKEAIERIKKLIKWFEKWDDDYTLVPCDKAYFETVLNLIEKQQAEIEDCKKCILRDEVHNYIEELEKKDLIINEMAENIADSANMYENLVNTEYEHTKKEVIEHFTQKIEKGE